MHVPLFLVALPLPEPVAVAAAEELEEDDMTEVTEVVGLVELADSSELVVPFAEELAVDEGTISVENAELVEGVELVWLVELVAKVVPAPPPVEAFVAELVTSVLWEPLPVTTGLTYTVSVLDGCGEAVEVMRVLAPAPPVEVPRAGAMELPLLEACPWAGEPRRRQAVRNATLRVIPTRERIFFPF